MLRQLILLHLYLMSLDTQHVRRRHRDERGSVTIEQVIWSVALISIVAIVVTAIRAYVTNKAGQIQ